MSSAATTRRFLVLAVAAALLESAVALFGETAASCRPPFLAGTGYPERQRPVWLTSVDLNGDGYPDLIAATESDSPPISVRLGHADGTFGPAIESYTGSGANALLIGRFNADSVPDAIVDTFFGLSFAVGNGDGTFQPATSLPMGDLASLVGADFNQDGNLDLAGVIGGGIVVILGNGDGTFQSPILTEIQDAMAIAVGDVNGDGKPDVVTAFGGDTLYVLFGLGNGQFDQPVPIVVGQFQQSPLLTDLDGDGKLDLLLAADFEIKVLLGNGNGTFQEPTAHPAGDFPVTLRVGDVDSDGHPDILALDMEATLGIVWILRGVGNGTFVAGGQYAVDSGPNAFVLDDFGNDGRLDIATGGFTIIELSVMLGKGDGSFDGARAFGLPAVPAISLASADFDEDGLPDLASGFRQSLQIFLNVGGANFVDGQLVDLGLTGVGPLVTADFNGDGHADLAFTAAYGFTGGVLLLGHGDGTFQDPISIPVAIPGLYMSGIATADFDGDGKPDLAFSEVSNTGGDVFVLLGHGDGSFGAPVDTTLPFQIQGITAGDFDEDGMSDVAVPSSNFGGKVTTLLSSGGGAFNPPTSYAVGSGSPALTAADLSGSGHLDLIVGNDASSAIAVLPGNGHGDFGDPIRYAVGKPTLALLAADIDHDGNSDIVTADGYVGTASVLLGLGNRAFRAPISLFAGYPFLMVGGDFDGNGYLDLVFSDSDSVRGALAVLLNGELTASTASASVVVSSSASLHANATGFGPLIYQWRKNGTPLSDGGPVSGSATATLTINPVAFADAGVYDVVVTDSCGSAVSNAANLSVEFDDVPLSNPFHDDIITIATAGITGGCTDTSYCPGNPVSRAEMAVFLLKAKDGADHVPPPPPVDPIFADVPADAFAAAWIDELASLGVTAGCGNGNYCPDDPVTRGEMAVFLLKTLLGSGYVPPPPAGIFADVPSDYFAIAWIEDLYNRGITAGCGTNPLTYCPDAAVPREQMATFLVRTFSLP